MDHLFSRLTLADVHQDLIRNIVSLRESQDLFDDLTENPEEWLLAQQVEDHVKPPPYRSHQPVIHRPFEDAIWFNAIEWPFKNWQASRFSDGSFGVWYGSDSAETTIYESAYHWYQNLLCDAGYEKESVVIERKLYAVACNAALLDLLPVAGDYPDLLNRTEYAYTRSVGARIHREGHPGLLVASVRRPDGENYAIFNPAVLSDPRPSSQLSYRMEGEKIIVEKTPGVPWLSIATGEF